MGHEHVKQRGNREPGGDHDEPPHRVEEAISELHGSRKQFRHRQAQRRRAPYELHPVIEKKNDTEGRNDVIEVIPVVEMSKDDEFEQKPKCQCGGERQHQRGEKAAGQRIESDGEVGPQHVLDAVRQVDDVHDPEHQRQPRRNQEQQHAELQPIENLNHEQGSGH